MRTRRNRLVLAAGVLASAGIVAAWFPASTLLHQHEQLAAAATQLNRLDQQNTALRHEEKQLRTPATLGRMAQQQYDLVSPGDQAYQVLPPSGSGSSAGTLALQGTPSTGKGATKGSRTSSASGRSDQASSSAGSSGSGTSRGFLGRVLQTLEFWR